MRDPLPGREITFAEPPNSLLQHPANIPVLGFLVVRVGGGGAFYLIIPMESRTAKFKGVVAGMTMDSCLFVVPKIPKLHWLRSSRAHNTGTYHSGL